MALSTHGPNTFALRFWPTDGSPLQAVARSRLWATDGRPGRLSGRKGMTRRTTTAILYRYRSEARLSRGETATSWSAKNFCHTLTTRRQRSALASRTLLDPGWTIMAGRNDLALARLGWRSRLHLPQ